MKQPPPDPCEGVPEPDLRIDPVPNIVQGVPFTLSGTTTGATVDVQLGDDAPIKSATKSKSDDTWSHTDSTPHSGSLTIHLTASAARPCSGIQAHGEVPVTIQPDNVAPSLTVSAPASAAVPDGGTGSITIDGSVT